MRREEQIIGGSGAANVDENKRVSGKKMQKGLFMNLVLKALL